MEGRVRRLQETHTEVGGEVVGCWAVSWSQKRQFMICLCRVPRFTGCMPLGTPPPDTHNTCKGDNGSSCCVPIKHPTTPSTLTMAHGQEGRVDT